MNKKVLKDMKVDNTKVIVSESFNDKVSYLCKRISKEEWSGVLLYTIKGTIKEPDKLKIYLEDILPLDKGTSGYTSYHLDSRYVDYFMEDEKRVKFKVGHIHSHNLMDVFFSGTDTDELKTNAKGHNFYLSVIVNNIGKYCAKIAYIAEQESSNKAKVKFFSLDERGKKFLSHEEEIGCKERVFIIDCDVDLELCNKNIPEDFKKKVDKIIEKSNMNFYNNYQNNSYRGQTYNATPNYTNFFLKNDNNNRDNDNKDMYETFYDPQYTEGKFTEPEVENLFLRFLARTILDNTIGPSSLYNKLESILNENNLIRLSYLERISKAFSIYTEDLDIMEKEDIFRELAEDFATENGLNEKDPVLENVFLKVSNLMFV